MNHFILTLIILSFLLTSCSKQQTDAKPVSAVKEVTLGESLSKSEKFLSDQKSEDGSWRSDHYAVFKDGRSLTPFVMTTMLMLDYDNKQAFQQSMFDTVISQLPADVDQAAAQM